MGNFILADLRPMGLSLHAVVVFGVGKNLLFKSVLGRCEIVHITTTAEDRVTLS